MFDLMKAFLLIISLLQFSPLVAQNRYQLLLQAPLNCADLAVVDTSLNWYLVCNTDSGVWLKRFDPTDQVHPDSVYFYGHFNESLVPYENTIFMVGTNCNWEEKWLSPKDTNFRIYSRYIRPGEKFELPLHNGSSASRPLTIRGSGQWSDETDYYVENYALKLTDYNSGREQILTFDFGLRDEGGIADLYWYGDLDGDLKPDMIFSTSRNIGSQFSLYLSSEGEPLIKRVSTFDWGNCF